MLLRLVWVFSCTGLYCKLWKQMNWFISGPKRIFPAADCAAQSKPRVRMRECPPWRRAVCPARVPGTGGSPGLASPGASPVRSERGGRPLGQKAQLPSSDSWGDGRADPLPCEEAVTPPLAVSLQKPEVLGAQRPARTGNNNENHAVMRVPIVTISHPPLSRASQQQTCAPSCRGDLRLYPSPVVSAELLGRSVGFIHAPVERGLCSALGGGCHVSVQPDAPCYPTSMMPSVVHMRCYHTRLQT